MRDGRIVASLLGQLPGRRRVAPARGVLRLSTAKAVQDRRHQGSASISASSRFRVDPGETVKVKVKLPAKAGSLAKRGKLGVRVVAASKEGGAVKESARNLTLRFAARLAT